MININYLKAGFLFSLISRYILIAKNSFILIFLTPFYLPFFLFIFVFCLLLYLVRKFLTFKALLKQKTVFLELTPPAFTDKTSYTTKQLFSVLHNVGSQRTLMEKILGKKSIFSFEIVSTRDQGIRYIVRTTLDEANIIQRNIVSYLPYVKVKQVDEYLPEKFSSVQSKIIEFELKKHFAFPLAKQNVLNEHDPVAYITGIMTKLLPGELISFQIVVSPVRNSEVETISQKILINEDVLNYLNRFKIPWYIKPVTLVFKMVITLIRVISQELLWAITEIYHGSSRNPSYAPTYADYQSKLVVTRQRPVRILSSFEQQTVESVQEKIDQELFETTIRAYVLVNNKLDQKQRVRGIRSSLSPFSVPKYQSLYAKYSFPPLLIDKIRSFTFRNRLLSVFNNKSSSLLSVSEIADLYHFPFTEITKTENIVKTYAKELPAPLSLKTGKKLDAIFGKNTYGNTITDIGLTDAERAKHIYLIGQTGSGKSTIIFHMAKEDIQKGRGVAVIDPHGDLAKDLLHCIPANRMQDVIYLNPFDLPYPIGINLLELPVGLTDDALELEKELVCENVISIFRRVFSNKENQNAHRIEYMLRNTIHTAFTLKERTIFTVYKLLTDPEYRKKVTADLEDEDLQNFWKNEFGIAGDYQVLKMIQGVTTKVGRFLFSPTAKRILEQEKSTINFDEILNQGKILICNLSEGKLGEDTSQLLGTMVISKIQQAAIRRERMEVKERKPFYLFVDEFQNFATTSFTKILSGGRKFGLHITIAEQSTSQQEERRIVNIILANTGTVICFRTASPLDEQLMLVQFAPYIEREDIVNLPNYKFYIKVSATKPEEPFSGETLKISVKRDKKKLERIIEASRKNYAIVYKKPEKKKAVAKPKEDNNDSENDIGTL